jgi:hypothetical protein
MLISSSRFENQSAFVLNLSKIPTSMADRNKKDGRLITMADCALGLCNLGVASKDCSGNKCDWVFGWDERASGMQGTMLRVGWREKAT